ncbi:hypothetical protein MMC16_003887 [Acarospora aff. strigata]|nr:hypothetical protein [Acarospora aff. strigata]
MVSVKSTGRRKKRILQLRRPTPFTTGYRTRSKTQRHTNGVLTEHIRSRQPNRLHGLGSKARQEAWKVEIDEKNDIWEPTSTASSTAGTSSSKSPPESPGTKDEDQSRRRRKETTSLWRSVHG